MSIFSSNKDTKDTGMSGNSASPVTSTPATSQANPGYQSTPSYNSSPLTSISEGTTLDGQIKIEGDIKIEGVVKGTVTSKGKVIISGSGKVDGDIICHSAEIGGHVGGKLKVADILFLKGNAVVDGDINTGKLVIENGVKFNGNCSMGNATANTAPSRPEPAVSKAPNTVELNAK
ncbi:MAG: polymer-forming cytoskeletal protein [Bacteroidetes bacterium]|nr:polymer-forming cytoskeletal protein [Bacteroidota bacterium]